MADREHQDAAPLSIWKGSEMLGRPVARSHGEGAGEVRASSCRGKQRAHLEHLHNARGRGTEDMNNTALLSRHVRQPRGRGTSHENVVVRESIVERQVHFRSSD